jgi:uncharacterized membrane protein YgcG
MLRALLSLTAGLALLAFGIYEIRSWSDLPLNRVPVAYIALMAGFLIAMFATLRLVFPRQRRSVGGDLGPDPGLSSGDFGHGGDCGHGDGGGCGSDGGGGH